MSASEYRSRPLAGSDLTAAPERRPYRSHAKPNAFCRRSLHKSGTLASREIISSVLETRADNPGRESSMPIRIDSLRAAALAAACILSAPLVAAGEEYVVRKGDSLQRIAKAQLGNEGQWGEIVRLNGLPAPYTIHAGQRLQLPTREGDAAAPSSSTAIAGPAQASHPDCSNEVSSWGRLAAYAGVGLLVLAGIVSLAGFILFAAAAFGEGFWWGVGTLLPIHPVWLVFLCRFWDKAKKGFLLQLAASPLALCGVGMLFLAGIIR
jgi:LysM repeat protein